jgi:BolA protein
VSQAFDGQAKIGRHRLVYDAVKHLMPHRIHALSIDAKTPSESL